jgi:hypothetical protein
MPHALIPILKALAPLAVSATGLVSAMRKQSSESTGLDARVKGLETAVEKSGEVVSGLAEQMQALVLGLEQQEDTNRRQAVWIKILLGLTVVSVLLAAAALTLALRK